MNERIKFVRNHENLSQAEFGKRLGVSGNFIYMVERGTNNMSDRTITTLCREFSVNEEWLRTGTGEPFVERSAEEELGNIFGMLDKDDSEFAKKKKALIRTLARLDEGSLEVLADIAEDWVKNM